MNVDPVFLFYDLPLSFYSFLELKKKSIFVVFASLGKTAFINL